MKIPPQIALWLQFKLYLLTLDGYCPDSFIYAQPGGLDDDPKFRWQLAVDTIHRCLACGLMEVWSEAWMKSVGVSNPLGLVKALMQHNPFNEAEFLESGAIFWIEPLLCSTSLCKSLIDKYDIPRFQGNFICEPFIEEIEALFDANGVGWSESLLVLEQKWSE